MTLANDITVLDKFAKGFPKTPTPGEGDRVWVAPLAAALTEPFPFDAHFVAYPSPNERRLNSEALDAGVVVQLTYAVFDVDCPATHGTSEPAPESWRVEQRQKIAELAAVHANPFSYETKGGLRVIYAQPEPTILRSREDAQRWRRAYAVACVYLARQFGIVADPCCADWTRLYRLPHVVRDGVEQDWPVWGDPEHIGPLSIEATQADVDAAHVLIPNAFRAPRVASAFRAGTSGKKGVLYFALHARGDVIREHEAGTYVIRCPNEKQHSIGEAGDESTLLYLPRPGDDLGAINCFHGHCTGKTVSQWLTFFSKKELDAARTAAGMVTRIKWAF